MLEVFNESSKENELTELPSWLTFDPSFNRFGLEKCGTEASKSDADCAKTPIAGNYRIYIEASIPETAAADGTGIVSDFNCFFDVEIIIDCDQDIFSFESSSDTVTYTVTTPSTAQTYLSPFDQNIPQCGFSCSLDPEPLPDYVTLDSSNGDV